MIKIENDEPNVVSAIYYSEDVLFGSENCRKRHRGSLYIYRECVSWKPFGSDQVMSITYDEIISQHLRFCGHLMNVLLVLSKMAHKAACKLLFQCNHDDIYYEKGKSYLWLAPPRCEYKRIDLIIRRNRKKNSKGSSDNSADQLSILSEQSIV